jgi:hypothetical protein
MNKIMEFVVARLGEARYLVFVGLICCFVGTAALALAALIPSHTQQTHDETGTLPNAHPSDIRIPYPASSHPPIRPLFPPRLLSTDLDCLSEEIIACSARIERDTSIAVAADYVHSTIIALRKLNPRLHGNRLKSGDRLTITSCMDRNTIPSLPETSACRFKRLNIKPDDPRVAGVPRTPARGHASGWNLTLGALS